MASEKIILLRQYLNELLANEKYFRRIGMTAEAECYMCQAIRIEEKLAKLEKARRYEVRR